MQGARQRRLADGVRIATGLSPDPPHRSEPTGVLLQGEAPDLALVVGGASRTSPTRPSTRRAVLAGGGLRAA